MMEYRKLQRRYAPMRESDLATYNASLGGEVPYNQFTQQLMKYRSNQGAGCC